MTMETTDIQAQIAQEEIVRNGISALIDVICAKAAPIYPRICARANRSMDDRHKIIEMAFELLVGENSTMTPDSALAQVESQLEWNQE